MTKQATLYLDPAWRVEQQEEAAGIVDATQKDIREVFRTMSSAAKATKTLAGFDADAAATLKRLGAAFLTGGSLFDCSEQEMAKAMMDPPSFRARVLNDTTKKIVNDKICQLRLFVAQRSNNPLNVEPTNGEYYHITAVYHDPILDHYHPFSAWVGINKDGQVKALKHLEQREQVMTRKSVSKGGAVRKPRSFYGTGRNVVVVRGQWVRPRWLEDVDEETGHRPIAAIPAMLTAPIVNDGLRVRAQRGDASLMVSVGGNEAKRLFSDRDVKDDFKRRIIHRVRPHYRLKADGSEQFVREHWRGERTFSMNGVSFEAHVSNWHAPDDERMSIRPVAENPEAMAQPGLVSISEIGRRVEAMRATDRFLSRRRH